MTVACCVTSNLPSANAILTSQTQSLSTAAHILSLSTILQHLYKPVIAMGSMAVPVMLLIAKPLQCHLLTTSAGATRLGALPENTHRTYEPESFPASSLPPGPNSTPALQPMLYASISSTPGAFNKLYAWQSCATCIETHDGRHTWLCPV